MMLYALALAATQFEDLDQLDRDVGVAAAAIGGAAQPIDRRLRLVHCVQGVQVTSEPRALAVRCPGGWRLRVPLSIAPVPAVAQTIVVRRGDPLTVVSGGDGFRVETGATASEDGALGATIRARLDGGTRQVSGRVSGPQELSVGRN